MLVPRCHLVGALATRSLPDWGVRSPLRPRARCLEILCGNGGAFDSEALRALQQSYRVSDVTPQSSVYSLYGVVAIDRQSIITSDSRSCKLYMRSDARYPLTRKNRGPESSSRCKHHSWCSHNRIYPQSYLSRLAVIAGNHLQE